MNQIELPTTAGVLGALLGAEVVGDPRAPVLQLSGLARARTGSLSFLSDGHYTEALSGAVGSVVLTRQEHAGGREGITFLIVSDPKASFAKVAASIRTEVAWLKMPKNAMVCESAEIHSQAVVGPNCFIGPGARIGAGTVVFPFAYVGAGVQIGENCEIHSHVTLYDGVQIGNRVKVFAGAVIGSAGFGYFRQGDTGPYTEMPQIGTVVVEDDVRIGANSTVDRATLDETRVGRGTKLDDHAHVGHNAQIAEDCIMCALAVIGGSAKLERDVVLGGQTGIGQGVTVGQGARLAGQAGSTTNVPRGLETYFFNPLIPVREFGRIYRVLRKLPKLLERVRDLERRVGEQTDG